MGNCATLLEWDANIPPFEDVHEEILKAKAYRSNPDRTANVG
jgi:uncharacterized protein (UPF0276 family)